MGSTELLSNLPRLVHTEGWDYSLLSEEMIAEVSRSKYKCLF